MSKNTIIAIIIAVIVLAVLGWIFIYKYPIWQKTKIRTYSLNAEIAKIEGNKVYLNIQKLTPDGQFFTTESKTALIGADTVISRVAQKVSPITAPDEEPKITYETTALQITDLKPGMILTLYTTKNPNNYSEFLATKIEVVR